MPETVQNLLTNVAVLSTRLEALEDRVTYSFAERDKARAVAVEGLEKSLQRMNEFRAALSDQAARFVIRTEHETLAAALAALQLSARDIAAQYVRRTDMDITSERITMLERAQTALTARYAMIALLFSASVVIANLLLAFWRH